MNFITLYCADRSADGMNNGAGIGHISADALPLGWCRLLLVKRGVKLMHFLHVATLQTADAPIEVVEKQCRTHPTITEPGLELTNTQRIYLAREIRKKVKFYDDMEDGYRYPRAAVLDVVSELLGVDDVETKIARGELTPTGRTPTRP